MGYLQIVFVGMFLTDSKVENQLYVMNVVLTNR